MTRRFTVLAAVASSVLVLQGCSNPFGSKNQAETVSSSSSSEANGVATTVLVSLQGQIIQEAGADNSFVLVTPSGDRYILSSDSVSFAAYAGKEAEVTGTLQQSSDGLVKLITVNEISEVVSSDSSVSSEMSSVLSSLSSESSSSEASSMSLSSLSSSSTASSKKPSSAVSSKASSVASPVSSSSVSSTSTSADMAARIKKMAKDRGPEAWTQQYCSSHIGVCFTVRSDFWYHSFGADTDTLWHVELSSEDIVNLGDGPMSVDLVSGRLEGELSDGLIREADGMVFGYRAWTNNRYFRVSAPKELRTAVEMITKSIAPYDTTPVQ